MYLIYRFSTCFYKVNFKNYLLLCKLITIVELSEDLKKYLIMQIIDDDDHPVLKWFRPEDKFDVITNLNYTPMDGTLSESLEKISEPLTDDLQLLKDAGISIEPDENMMMDGMGKLSKDFEILKMETDNFRFELLKDLYHFAQFEVAFRLDKEDDKIFSQMDADALIKNLEKFKKEVTEMGLRLGRNLDFKGSSITKK